MLCKRCDQKWAKNFGDANADNTDDYPWLHCHHEEEKKGCAVCRNDRDVLIEWRYHGSRIYSVPTFCPECGRKL